MSNKQIALAAGLVAIVVLAGGVLYYWSYWRSAGPTTMTNLVTARSIDATGNPIGSTTVFDKSNDQTVYAVVTLAHAKKTTKIAYIRYFNGKYVDSKVTIPTKDGAKGVIFNFEKGIGKYPAGAYTIVTYVDGKKALSTSYSFR